MSRLTKTLCLISLVDMKGEELFYTHVHLYGGPAPVRRYLPQLMDLILNEKINPGKVFDLTVPIDQVAEGYRAMDDGVQLKRYSVHERGTFAFQNLLRPDLEDVLMMRDPRLWVTVMFLSLFNKNRIASE